jgi:Xaa-Pro aminopeptidase
MVRKSLDRAVQESPLDRIIAVTSIKKIPAILADNGYECPQTLGMEMDVIPAANYLLYQQIFNQSRLVDASVFIRAIRLIKSEFELELQRASGKKMNELFKTIPGMIREGMNEVELAGRIEGMARSLGHSGFVNLRSFNQSLFYGVIAAGATAAMPSAFDGPANGTGLTPLQPESAGLKAISKNEPVIVDIAGIWDSYITDMTRIFAIGPLSGKLLTAFELSLKIQAAVLNMIEPGVTGSELHQLALEMAAAAGFSDNFMGFGPNQAKFLGHGVGLELDELPVLASGVKSNLMPGMVFALEPKFTFPGEGVVGIENTFAMTESGLERLTITPDELVIL